MGGGTVVGEPMTLMLASENKKPLVGKPSNCQVPNPPSKKWFRDVWGLGFRTLRGV